MSEDEDWQPLEDDTFLSTIGQVVQRKCNGMIEIGLHASERHRNLSGTVHGGLIMTLIDRALGVNARLAGQGRRMATASMTVNFQRPARSGDFLHVTCTLTKNGRKSAFGEARLYVDGKIAASATGVFMTVESPKGE